MIYEVVGVCIMDDSYDYVMLKTKDISTPLAEVTSGRSTLMPCLVKWWNEKWGECDFKYNKICIYINIV